MMPRMTASAIAVTGLPLSGTNATDYVVANPRYRAVGRGRPHHHATTVTYVALREPCLRHGDPALSGTDTVYQASDDQAATTGTLPFASLAMFGNDVGGYEIISQLPDTYPKPFPL
jgi:hypothetical protein